MCIFECGCAATLVSVVIGLLILAKICIKLTTGAYEGEEKLDGKTVIITGASAGIGAECAKDFAKRGARIIMTCRDMVKGENLRKSIMSSTGNSNLVLKHLDFMSLESVRKCAAEILKEESEIHILLNNAGSGGLGMKKKTEDGLEALMQTNYFGPFLFTNILLDKIVKSSPGRIVNVSSLAHRFGKLDLANLDMSNVSNEVTVYSNTKLANVMFTNELARKLNGTGVTVNSLHPGVVLTDIVRNAPYLFRMVWNLILSLFFKTAEEGAATSIYLCVCPSVSHLSGQYFSDCTIARMNSEAKDAGKCKKLWELSEEAVKMKACEKYF